MPYFRNFEDDISFEECIIYLILTPILYFAILIMIEEKVFAKLFMKITSTKLKSNNCDKMDDEVKKEKLAIAQEINELNSQGNIIFNIFQEIQRFELQN